MVKSTQAREILDISTNYKNYNMLSRIGMIAVQKDFSKRALAFRLIGIGWYIAFCLIFGALGGYWLDSHLNNDFPIFSLIGVTLGLLIAMVGLYFMVRPLMKEDNEIDKEDD